jgi:hypothetical protein
MESPAIQMISFCIWEHPSYATGSTPAAHAGRCRDGNENSVRMIEMSEMLSRMRAVGGHAQGQCPVWTYVRELKVRSQTTSSQRNFSGHMGSYALAMAGVSTSAPRSGRAPRGDKLVISGRIESE